MLPSLNTGQLSFEVYPIRDCEIPKILCDVHNISYNRRQLLIGKGCLDTNVSFR